MASDPHLHFPGAGGKPILVRGSEVFDFLTNRVHRCLMILRNGAQYPLACSPEDARRILDGAVDLVELDPDPTPEVR